MLRGLRKWMGWLGLLCVTASPASAAADPLDFWTARGGVVTNLLQNIAYGNGRLVAVGYGGTVITSTDGVSWEAQNSGTTDSFYTVVFGGDLFVAAGNNGVLAVSQDGASWTLVNSGTRNPFFGSAYGNGTYLVVGGSNVLASANGVLWEPRASSLLPRAYLNAAAYGAGKFVAVGAGGRALISEDTYLWSISDSELGNHFSMTYAEGLFVAVGGGFGALTEMASSADGITWRSVVIPSFASAVDVAHGNGRFLALGLSVFDPPPFSPEVLFESADGLTWETRTLPTLVGIYGLTYAQSRFFAVGGAGVVLQSESFAPAWLQLNPLPGTNGMQIQITGEIGRPYRLQTSSDANGPVWQDFLQFSNPSEPETVITDPRASRFARRFYRVISP